MDDGMALSYYSIGKGPGLLVLHGAASYALSQLELAELLAGSYTVYLLSRRGRGLSCPYPKEVTDLTPVLLASEVSTELRVAVGGKEYQRTYNPLFTATALIASTNAPLTSPLTIATS